MRVCTEPVMVRTVSGEAGAGPEWFVCRHRWWRVLAVYRHRIETAAGWTASRGQQPDEPPAGDAGSGAGPLADAWLPAEQQIWRAATRAGAGQEVSGLTRCGSVRQSRVVFDR